MRFPEPAGHVNDFSGAIGEPWAQRIEALCRQAREDRVAEIAVVSVASVSPLDVVTYGTELFRAWGIGRKGVDDGVLVLHAAAERRLRIETGYGAEGWLPDAWLGSMVEGEVRPLLREGRIGEALFRAASAIEARARSGRAPGQGEAPAGAHGDAPWLAFALALGVSALVLWLARRRLRGWRRLLRGGRTGTGRDRTLDLFGLPGGFGGPSGGFGGSFSGFSGGLSGGGGVDVGF